MYCGDETGSFIGEIGSHSCRFGYGGEDNPKLVFPSFVANKRTMPSSTVAARLSHQDIQSILRRPDDNASLTDPNTFLRQGDIVEHWDNLQVVWDTAMEVLRAKDTLKHTTGGAKYAKSLTGSSSDGKCVHPILAITPGMTHYDGYGASYCASVKRQQYIQYTELLLEEMDASSLFLAPAPMLAAFSVGRQTALVVDIGAGGTRVTPVVDGLLLEQAQRRSGRGGDWLGHVTWQALLLEKITPKPRYLIREDTSAHPCKSSLFHTWAIQDLMYELRTESFIQVEATPSTTPRIPFAKSSFNVNSDVGMRSPSASRETANAATSIGTPTNYQFPDGSVVDLCATTFGNDLTRIPELLFSRTLPFGNPLVTSTLPTFTDAPLHELIHSSLLAVGDVDVRKELSNNIVLIGGSSLFPNLDARLSYELSNLLPNFTRPKVIAPRFSVERSCAPWIGASILTSLGSFQQLWLSRTEYEEYGSTMAIQRFP